MRRKRTCKSSQFGNVVIAIVDAVDHRPLKADTAPLGTAVVGQGARQVAQGIRAVDRCDAIAQAVVRGVQRDCQIDRQAGSCQTHNARNDTDSGHRDVPGTDAHVAMEALHGCPHRVIVGERLAHAHEHDVHGSAADGSARRAAGAGRWLLQRAQHLLDDFPDAQIPVESHLARCAETARHGTASLAADAQRGPIAVAHEHGLHQVSITQRPQVFAGLAAIRCLGTHQLQRWWQQLADGLTQALGNVGQLGQRAALAVQAVPHLVQPVRGLAIEQLSQLCPGEIRE